MFFRWMCRSTRRLGAVVILLWAATFGLVVFKAPLYGQYVTTEPHSEVPDPPIWVRQLRRLVQANVSSTASKDRRLELHGDLTRELDPIYQSLGEHSESGSDVNSDKIEPLEVLQWAEVIEQLNGTVKKKKQREAEEYVSEKTLSMLKLIVNHMNQQRVPQKPKGDNLDLFDAPENGTESDLPAWQRLQNHMSRHRLYSPDDGALEEVLHNLRTLPIAALEFTDAGTQVKMFYTLSDGMRVIAKPKRKELEYEASPDVYHFDDFERFQAEITAFHLDRILGFYRVPPVVARYVNVSSEIYDMAPEDWQDTFYRSYAGNECFFGICDQFCAKPFAFCGKPEMLATSFGFFLPTLHHGRRKSWDNPYAQTYSRWEPAEWYENATYCQDLIDSDPMYQKGSRRLLDVIELASFDFIQTNLDRHSFHSFKTFRNDSNIFGYDNGRALSRSYTDEMGLLTALTQCCRYRLSTLERLLDIYTSPGGGLSARLQRSLATEDISPLITDSHLRAFDRRLGRILQAVADCVTERGHYRKVVVDDGY